MIFNKEKANKGIPLLPLRDIVIFPHMIVPLFVGRERSIKALDEAEHYDNTIFLVTQKDAQVDDPKEKDLFEVGVAAEILQMLKLPDGTIKVLVEGLHRAGIKSYSQVDPYLRAEVVELTEHVSMTREIEAQMRSVCGKFEQCVKLNSKLSPEILISVSNIEEPGRLADVIASHWPLKVNE